jgi:PAS domain S-box-containing protein
MGTDACKEVGRPDEALDKRELEEFFRTLISQVKDHAIFRTDVNGRPVSWNQGVEVIFGYTREEFIGSSFELPFLPDDIVAGIPARELEQARRAGVANDDRWLRRKNGEAFYATGTTTRLTDAEGNCIGFSKVLRDDTPHRLAQDRLKKSEERYRTIVDNVRDYAIFPLDPQGFITEWPKGAQRVKGYSPDETIGHHLAMFYPQEDVAAGEVDKELDEAARVGQAERESWRICEGGKRIWVNEIATAIRDGDETLVGFIKISRDLTERRRVEQAFREADQRKDEFLATLAHELRNPLAPLRNGLHVARLMSKTDSTLQRTVAMMDRAEPPRPTRR